jgi:formate hydrogenlyase transcriptional activator
MELRREDYGFTQENANFLMQRANHVASRLKRPCIWRDKELKNMLAREKLYLEEEIRSE